MILGSAATVSDRLPPASCMRMIAPGLAPRKARWTITLTPGVALNVALSGASFVVGEDISPTNSLAMHVAGDFVTIVLDPYDFGGYITERLAPATYVQLLGSVAGSVGASGEFSLPFEGVFDYCVKQSDTLTAPPLEGPFGCRTNDLVYKRCDSSNHRVMLTRR